MLVQNHVSYDLSCESVQQMLNEFNKMPLTNKRISLALTPERAESKAPIVEYLESIKAIVTDVSPDVFITSPTESTLRLEFIENRRRHQRYFNFVIVDLIGRCLPIKKHYGSSNKVKLHVKTPDPVLRYIGTPFIKVEDADDSSFIDTPYKREPDTIKRFLRPMELHVNPYGAGYCEHCKKQYPSPQAHRNSIPHNYNTKSLGHWEVVDALLRQFQTE